MWVWVWVWLWVWVWVWVWVRGADDIGWESVVVVGIHCLIAPTLATLLLSTIWFN